MQTRRGRNREVRLTPREAPSASFAVSEAAGRFAEADLSCVDWLVWSAHNKGRMSSVR